MAFHHVMVMENQLNKINSDQNDNDSKATIMYSSVSKKVIFAQLPLNTDLNKSPSNFLTNEAEDCGVYHNLSQSDEFTSYQTAHMFPDLVGDIDIISNSTNIKKLLKIPYSGNSVSMILHRVENTLFIDNYDVRNNLMAMRSDRAWLNNIAVNYNLKNADIKGKRFTKKKKSFKVIQEETLKSKFLHHSIGESIDCDENSQLQYKKLLPHTPTWLADSLPKLTRGDKYPTECSNLRTHNQYMLWNFAGSRFLIGSDLPIFIGDNNSQSSLRLRDMSKPMNSLTGMDYWLDNLICNVDELQMCYHLNGIVKYNKTVLTEDIPHLKHSTFSPNDVNVATKNLFSILKYYVTDVGHVYWLIKEKRGNVIKLYNLRFIYSIKIYKNLFAIPKAILLYRVVRNTKHNQNNGRPSNSNSNQILLVNCLQLLDETKYPEITVSVCYLLSDIFIPVNTNVRYPDLENLVFVNSPLPVYNVNEEYNFVNNNGAFSIDIKDLLQPLLEKDEYPEFEKLKSKPDVLTVEHRCKKALYCVGRGLESLNYKKKPDVQMTNKKNEKNVAILATSVDEKTGNKNKSRGGKKKTIAVENNKVTVCNTQHSLECYVSKTYTWNKIISFFYKASLAFTILAEQDYLALRYGKALNNFRFAYQCHVVIFTINGDNNQFGYLLECVSVCCLLIAKNWACVNQYVDEMNAPNESIGSNECIKKFLDIDCEACKKYYTFIPDKIVTKFGLLNSAESCYQESLKFGTYDHDKTDLYKTLICSTYINYSKELIHQMSNIAKEKCDFTFMSVVELINYSEKTLENGIAVVTSYGNTKDITIMHMYMGKWYTHLSVIDLILRRENSLNTEKTLIFLIRAKENHSKALDKLTNDRLSYLSLWTKISQKLFLASCELAITNQNIVYKELDNVTDDNEKQVLDLLKSTLKSADLTNETKYSMMYKIRTAQLQDRVAIVYLFMIQKNVMSEQKKQITYRDCMFHYQQAYEMYLEINCPLENLEIIISMIIVDEKMFKDVTSAHYKINMFVSIGNTLSKCVPVLQILLAMDDDPQLNSSIDTSIRDQRLSTLLQQIQNLLKTTIKCVMGKKNGLSTKLKPVYKESLIKKDDENEMSHILRIIPEIIDIIQFLN